MFMCDCCGLCCMNLKMSDLYKDLDRGDGICINFNINNKLCMVYANRPIKCNIDKMYESGVFSELTRDEYYELNYRACSLLKECTNI